VTLPKKEVSGLLKILKPKPKSRFLDVPCGRGRHAFLLAKKGYAVTGVDIAPTCIRGAKKQINGQKNIQFYEADILNLKKYYEKFDTVLNLFTSFGYLKNEKLNDKSMVELVRCLVPGGKLALHTINRQWLEKHHRPLEWTETPEYYKVEKRIHDPKSNYNFCKVLLISKKTKKVREYDHKVRLYDSLEMTRLMKKSGLKNITIYGDFDGGRFYPAKHSHPIYVGEKA